MEASPELIEDLDRQPAGIARAFEHHGRYRADEDSFGDAFAAVPSDITRDPTSSGRTANVDCLL